MNAFAKSGPLENSSIPPPNPSVAASSAISLEPLRIYTGILGQVGDIIMFTGTVRRLKELFPNSQITFAVSEKYHAAGELVAGLPYVDRLFVTKLYCERLTYALLPLWEAGWPVDLRGEDEVVEQSRHDIVLQTRPPHRRERWWEHAHQVVECAHMVGVPGPIDLRTEIRIPEGTVIPPETEGKIVLHNDPAISPAKAWPWEYVQQLVHHLGEGQTVLLGFPGPPISGCLDLRGKTTLAQAAAIIAACRCYIGIDSGLMWAAGSLQVPAIGLYGTTYIPAHGAIHPRNPNAIYLQANGPVGCITPQDVLEALDYIRSRAEQGTSSQPLEVTRARQERTP